MNADLCAVRPRRAPFDAGRGRSQSSPFDRRSGPRRPAGRSWIGRAQAGTSFIGACSDAGAAGAARPRSSSTRMCMCTSTKRRCPRGGVARWSKRIARCANCRQRAVDLIADPRLGRPRPRGPRRSAASRRPPSRRMFSATPIASSGSEPTASPSAGTRSRPTTTPAEVQTIDQQVARVGLKRDRAVLARRDQHMRHASSPLSSELRDRQAEPRSRAPAAAAGRRMGRGGPDDGHRGADDRGQALESAPGEVLGLA